MSQNIKILLFSTLYPSSVRPFHGIFVETRLRELLKSGCIEAQVVAPVPWFPSSDPRFGEYARFAATPPEEDHNGVRVHHPRYLLPPKVGQSVAPFVLAAGALRVIRRLIVDGFDFDLIDAHFWYPDGVAASIIARKLGKPFVCTARGSDINVFRQFALPRRMLQSAFQKSAANIGVSSDLVEQMVSLGAPQDSSIAIRNGVDLDRFRPMDRASARRALGERTEGLLLLSVGNLVELKGHHLVIPLLKEFPDSRLIVVGVGPMRGELEALAVTLGVQGRVTFAGRQPNDALSTYYSAADALLLASRSEGWANVLLESMACGTPVVATRVNGTPEVVASRYAGQLAEVRDTRHLAFALRTLLADYPQKHDVRAYAEGFSWEETTKLQCELFSRISGKQIRSFA